MKILLITAVLFFFMGCKKKTDDNPLNKVETITLSIPTAGCNICAKSISKAIYRVEGVKDVEVNLEKKIVEVTYVPFQTNIETIEITITDAGYDANKRKRNQHAYEIFVTCCKIESQE